KCEQIPHLAFASRSADACSLLMSILLRDDVHRSYRITISLSKRAPPARHKAADGRGGIRNHGGFPHARFRVECLKPDSATLPLRKKERRTSSVQRKYHTGILSARRLCLLAATSPGLGLAWRVPSWAVSALAARIFGRTR